MPLGIQSDQWELYQELAAELQEPVDQRLDLAMRYELYLSKFVYLNNLFQKCFEQINRGSLQSNTCYDPQDLVLIRRAIDSTAVHMRSTIFSAIECALEKRAHALTPGREAEIFEQPGNTNKNQD